MLPLRTARRPRRVYASFTPADFPPEIVGLLYTFVDLPFAFRATCRAIRDAQPAGTIEGPMLSKAWDGYKTKTAIADVVQDVRLLAWACESGCHWSDRVGLYAAKCGREEAIHYLCTFRGYLWDASVPEAAAANGQLETLTWLHDHRPRGETWNYDVCDAAAEKGHLACLQYVFDKGFPFSSQGLNAAALGGHYECVKFLLDQNAKAPVGWDPTRSHAADYAAKGGHIDILRLLQEHGVPWTDDTALNAAVGGDFDCFRWLVNKGCPYGREACFEAAAIEGHVPLVRWFIETLNHAQEEPYFDGGLLTELAYRGKTEVLKVAHDVNEFREHVDDYFCENAASGGHLDTLKWLRHVGCPLGSTIVEQAAGGGHLHVLDWLWELDRGEVQWGYRYAFDGAIREGHIPAIEWAMKKGLPGSWREGETLTLPERACQLGNLDVVKWAVSLGHELSSYAVYYAAAWNKVRVLRWLIEESGVTYDWDRLWSLVRDKEARGQTARYIEELERERRREPDSE